MVKDELVDYFLEGTKRGYSVEVLSKRLIEEGWDEEDVDKAAMAISDNFNEHEKKKGLFSFVKKKL